MPQSVFISYGGPDHKFALRLRDAFEEFGVNSFLFSHDAIPGQKLHRVMRDGVNGHDRVVLVCSQNSLDRLGVLNELEETLQREAREGGESLLVPITIDDYVFQGWSPKQPGLAQAVRDRVIADFRGTDCNYAAFEKALQQLVTALGVTEPRAANVPTWLVGVWEGSWEWRGNQRDAELRVASTRLKPSLVTISYTKFGQKTVVEEQVDVEARDDVVTLTAIGYRFLEKGAAVGWHLDTFQLKRNEAYDRLIGQKVDKRGIMGDVVFGRIASNTAVAADG